MNSRMQPWRWLVKTLQAVVVLGLPFLTVGGQSALRFDVPSLTLHFFGTPVVVDEFFPVLIAVLFLTFLIITLTILLGRIWCGWLCPQTVIADFTRFIDRSVHRRPLARAGALLAVLAISPVLAAGILWYFVSPQEFFRRLVAGDLGPVIGWSWALLTAVTFLNFAFLRQTFCSTVCPYAKLQGSWYDDRTLVITADAGRMDECMRCDACVRTCPVGIDVRRGLHAACINCAECIDACAARMEQRGKRSLIGYRFGTGTDSRTAQLGRRPVVMSGAASAIFLALLMVLVMTRRPFELEVLADSVQRPRVLTDGVLVNAFMLSMTNRSKTDLTITVTARAKGRNLAVTPSSLMLPRGAHIRNTVTVRMGATPEALAVPEPVTISAEALQLPGMRQERLTTFMPPWESP